jgi:hypothetical protein
VQEIMDALLARFVGALRAAGVSVDDDYVLAETRFRLSTVLETLTGYVSKGTAPTPAGAAAGGGGAPTTGSGAEVDSSSPAHVALSALQLVRAQ